MTFLTLWELLASESQQKRIIDLKNLAAIDNGFVDTREIWWHKSVWKSLLGKETKGSQIKKK